MVSHIISLGESRGKSRARFRLHKSPLVVNVRGDLLQHVGLSQRRRLRLKSRSNVGK